MSPIRVRREVRRRGSDFFVDTWSIILASLFIVKIVKYGYALNVNTDLKEEIMTQYYTICKFCERIFP